VVDELPRFREHRPGPLVALQQFVARDGRFVIDKTRSAKFLFPYSPNGCLRRIR
jgi:cephalosporin hydroxylase